MQSGGMRQMGWAARRKSAMATKILWFTLSPSRDYGLRDLNHKNGMHHVIHRRLGRARSSTDVRRESTVRMFACTKG
jgi:hypothetical protein